MVHKKTNNIRLEAVPGAHNLTLVNQSVSTVAFPFHTNALLQIAVHRYT